MALSNYHVDDYHQSADWSPRDFWEVGVFGLFCILAAGILVEQMKRHVWFAKVGAACAVSIALLFVYLAFSNRPKRFSEWERQQFVALRTNAEKISEGIFLSDVTNLLGSPDRVGDWLPHLPKWRLYYFDLDRTTRFRTVPDSYVAVLIDDEGKVLFVDVHDSRFSTCSGRRIKSTCVPINRSHYDRLVGPVIVGG